MQIVSVPLFNESMAVVAYMFRYNKGNELFSTTQTTNIFDGAARNEVLEALNYVGIDAFAFDKPIFVPVTAISLLSRLHMQNKQPPDRIVFLLEDYPGRKHQLADSFLSHIDELISMGYHFAISDIPNVESYLDVLKRCEYCFLSQDEEHAQISDRVIREINRRRLIITAVATSLQSASDIRKLPARGYTIFESRFFSVEKSATETNISPLKINSIQLLNTVQNENFDFEQVSKIIQSDPALAISLLKLVNARSYGSNQIKSITQAVAMLGQQEVRKWVTTAVAQSLGDDRPNEITKVSLVRAKFAENLAPLYELAHMSQGIFMMGLFSLVDLILEVPMEKALGLVLVSDMIKNALLNKSGLYYPILDMVTSYERADWMNVSRFIIIHNIDQDELRNAYLEAMIWYEKIVSFGASATETEQSGDEAQNAAQ